MRYYYYGQEESFRCLRFGRLVSPIHRQSKDISWKAPADGERKKESNRTSFKSDEDKTQAWLEEGLKNSSSFFSELYFQETCARGWKSLGSGSQARGSNVLFALNKVWAFIFLQSNCLYLHTSVLPQTTTDGVARIFFLTPRLWPGIKPTAQLHLFEGP